ncbi:MAG TPA: hypothetical protein VMH20_19220 [Verrucomicrobiae bacterium]|jgi:hypothetical protein|nr:hypothetical protein [Verrucomicrobiae bacterium]
MRRLTVTIVSGFLFAGIAVAQSDKDLTLKSQAESAPNSANERLPEGATIPATLTKAVDSDKVKKGDQVTARTIAATKADGKTVIPEDSIVRGHVTQTSARGRGDSFSTLGIVFDKAVLKNGEEMPINVNVQAIAPPASAVNSAPSPSTTPLKGGSSKGGAGQGNSSPATPASPPTVPDTVGNTGTNQATPAVKGGLDDNGVLKPNSRGVYGFQGIGMATSSDGQHAAVITSTDKSVHLNSGTQLLLAAEPVGTQTSTR